MFAPDHQDTTVTMPVFHVFGAVHYGTCHLRFSAETIITVFLECLGQRHEKTGSGVSVASSNFARMPCFLKYFLLLCVRNWIGGRVF